MHGVGREKEDEDDGDEDLSQQMVRILSHITSALDEYQEEERKWHHYEEEEIHRVMMMKEGKR